MRWYQSGENWYVTETINIRNAKTWKLTREGLVLVQEQSPIARHQHPIPQRNQFRDNQFRDNQFRDNRFQVIPPQNDRFIPARSTIYTPVVPIGRYLPNEPPTALTALANNQQGPRLSTRVPFGGDDFYVNRKGEVFKGWDHESVVFQKGNDGFWYIRKYREQEPSWVVTNKGIIPMKKFLEAPFIPIDAQQAYDNRSLFRRQHMMK